MPSLMSHMGRLSKISSWIFWHLCYRGTQRVLKLVSGYQYCYFLPSFLPMPYIQASIADHVHVIASRVWIELGRCHF